METSSLAGSTAPVQTGAPSARPLPQPPNTKSSAKGAPVADSPENQRPEGLFLDLRVPDDTKAVASAASSSLGIRKDPNLEFFQMLLLSYKMNNQDLEEVMELDHREMYLKCTESEKVTFFHFPDWIAKEINKIRFRKVYHQNKKRLERNKKLLNKLEAMDGIKFVRDVKILHNYFDT